MGRRKTRKLLDIRFRDVPPELPRSLVNMVWRFTEEVDATVGCLHEAGVRVFNARFSADPAEWEARLAAAEENLYTVGASLASLQRLFKRIKRQTPEA